VVPAEEIGHPRGETPQDEARDSEPLAVVSEIVDAHAEIAQPLAVGSTECLEDPPIAVVGDADVEVAAKLLKGAEVVGMVDHGVGLVMDGPAFGEQSRPGADVFADEFAPAETADRLEGGSSIGGKSVGDERRPQTEPRTVIRALGDGLVGVVEEPLDLCHRVGSLVGDLPTKSGADPVIGEQRINQSLDGGVVGRKHILGQKDEHLAGRPRRHLRSGTGVIEIGPFDGEVKGAGSTGEGLDLGGGIGDHEPEFVTLEALSSDGGE